MNFKSFADKVTKTVQDIKDDLSQQTTTSIFDVFADDKKSKSKRPVSNKTSDKEKRGFLPEPLDAMRGMSDTITKNIKGAIESTRSVGNSFASQTKTAALTLDDKMDTIFSEAEFLQSHNLEDRNKLCCNAELKDFARIASHVYGKRPNSFLNNRWRVINRIHDKETDLMAALYQYQDFDKFVIAFAGTRSWRDVGEDLMQVVGLSNQFNAALSYAEETISKFHLQNVTFVGHSQGGGEAAYCACCLGHRAITFNPAGVSTMTKLRSENTTNKRGRIDAYIYVTDILNIVQELSGITNWTLATGIHPDGNIHYLGLIPKKRSHIHGMEGFLDYFKIKY